MTGDLGRPWRETASRLPTDPGGGVPTRHALGRFVDLVSPHLQSMHGQAVGRVLPGLPPGDPDAIEGTVRCQSGDGSLRYAGRLIEGVADDLTGAATLRLLRCHAVTPATRDQGLSLIGPCRFDSEAVQLLARGTSVVPAGEIAVFAYTSPLGDPDDQPIANVVTVRTVEVVEALGEALATVPDADAQGRDALAVLRDVASRPAEARALPDDQVATLLIALQASPLFRLAIGTVPLGTSALLLLSLNGEYLKSRAPSHRDRFGAGKLWRLSNRTSDEASAARQPIVLPPPREPVSKPPARSAPVTADHPPRSRAPTPPDDRARVADDLPRSPVLERPMTGRYVGHDDAWRALDDRRKGGRGARVVIGLILLAAIIGAPFAYERLRADLTTRPPIVPVPAAAPPTTPPARPEASPTAPSTASDLTPLPSATPPTAAPPTAAPRIVVTPAIGVPEDGQAEATTPTAGDLQVQRVEVPPSPPSPSVQALPAVSAPPVGVSLAAPKDLAIEPTPVPAALRRMRLPVAGYGDAAAPGSGPDITRPEESPVIISAALRAMRAGVEHSQSWISGDSRGYATLVRNGTFDDRGCPRFRITRVDTEPVQITEQPICSVVSGSAEP